MQQQITADILLRFAQPKLAYYVRQLRMSAKRYMKSPEGVNIYDREM